MGRGKDGFWPTEADATAEEAGVGFEPPRVTSSLGGEGKGEEDHVAEFPALRLDAGRASPAPKPAFPPGFAGTESPPDVAEDEGEEELATPGPEGAGSDGETSGVSVGESTSGSRDAMAERKTAAKRRQRGGREMVSH